MTYLVYIPNPTHGQKTSTIEADTLKAIARELNLGFQQLSYTSGAWDEISFAAMGDDIGCQYEVLKQHHGKGIIIASQAGAGILANAFMTTMEDHAVLPPVIALNPVFNPIKALEDEINRITGAQPSIMQSLLDREIEHIDIPPVWERGTNGSFIRAAADMFYDEDALRLLEGATHFEDFARALNGRKMASMSIIVAPVGHEILKEDATPFAAAFDAHAKGGCILVKMDNPANWAHEIRAQITALIAPPVRTPV